MNDALAALDARHRRRSGGGLARLRRALDRLEPRAHRRLRPGAPLRRARRSGAAADDQVRNQPERAAQGGRALPDRPRALPRRRGARGRAHAVFFRSPVAHARIAGLDVAEAAAAPGVLAVITAADLDGKMTNAMDFEHGPEPRRQPGRRRRAGRCSPTTASATSARRSRWCVAETRAAGARRARADRLRLRRSAGAHGDRRGRAGDPPRGAGEPRLRLGLRRRGRGRGDLRARRAHHPARAHRQPGDGDADGAARLLRRVGRRAAARRLLRPGGLGAEGRARREARPAREAVRVTTPDVGGGFGIKGFTYPEYFAVAFAARAARPPGALDERPAARRC